MNTQPPARRKPPSFGITEFLFVIFLTVILFLLGQSMVEHRFFQGGRDTVPVPSGNRVNECNRDFATTPSGRHC
jgi:hypothetical protein